MQIKKSELRNVIKEQVAAFFVTPQPFGMVSRSNNLESSLIKFGINDADKKELTKVIKQTMSELEEEATKRMKSSKLKEAKKKPAKWYDAIKRPVKVGDKVHVGHAQKGGAGVEGKVTKIAGNIVYIKNDRIGLFGGHVGKTYKGSLKNTAILEISGVDSLKPNDPHTPEDEAEKDAADDVMEAGPEKKGGRPRGAPHIENVKFWDLPEKSLRYIIKDASQAVAANPTARKAGKWADEVNDAVTVLYWRKKKGIKIDESFNTAPAGQGKKQASVISTDDNETNEIGSLATTPKAKNLIKQMHILVSKKLKLKSIEDIQPIQGGVAFIFGEKNDATKMTNYLKKKKVLGKVIPLAGGNDRTMVSLKLGPA